MICGEFLGIKVDENIIEVKLLADNEEIIDLIKTYDFEFYQEEKINFDTLKLQSFNKWRKKIIDLINKRENYYLINYKIN